MKRPEGFDPGTPESAASKGRGGAAGKPLAKPTEQLRPKKPAARDRVDTRGSRKPRRDDPGAGSSRERKVPAANGSGSGFPGSDADGSRKAQARTAAKNRRRYERSEVRRFTRRTRNRRLAWLVSSAAVVALLGMVAIAVYSPILALKTLRVEGASRVSAADIRTAVGDQLGTPLALVDFARIKTELAKFPLIRSYVTETVPPDTLIIHIVERSPIGAIATASGFVVVDPAGVTISSDTERPAKLPLIDSGSTKTGSEAFRAAVAVLLALPDSVLSRVDKITARTNDDVTLVLDGVGQRVVWGSADRSAVKARVLADLISHQNPNTVVEYDVSAPNNAVVRPG